MLALAALCTILVFRAHPHAPMPASGTLTLAQATPPSATEVLERAQDTATKAANDFTGMVRSDPWRWGHIIAAGLVVLGLLFADVLRPGSLERSGKRDVSVFGAHIWFLCALLVLAIQMVSGGLAGLLPGTWLGAGDSLQHQAVVQSVVYGVSLVCAYLLVRLISASAVNGGLKFSAHSSAWGFLAFLLAWPVIISSTFLWLLIEQRMHGELPANPIAHNTLQLLVDNRNSPWAWTIAGLAIVGAPIVEEIVYRGFLQSAILRATNSPWLSILVTSALFAGIHLLGKQPVPWYAAATIGVLGLSMGIAFERTKEVGVPITMHVLYNLANVALALVTTKPAG